MEAKEFFMGLFVALIALVVFLVFILSRGVNTVSQGVDSLVPNLNCPADTKIADTAKMMRTFAGTGSKTPEPGYALEVFKKYLACKNPKVGSSPFTTAEIERYDDEMLACAKAAYVSHISNLNTKKTESKEYPEDVSYYEGEVRKYTKELNTFNIIFPESDYAGTMCNAEATGRETPPPAQETKVVLPPVTTGSHWGR